MRHACFTGDFAVVLRVCLRINNFKHAYWLLADYHLAPLIADGTVVATGSTRDRRFILSALVVRESNLRTHADIVRN